MVTICPVADDKAAGKAERPVAANASFAPQPASLHYGDHCPPPVASYNAGTAPSLNGLPPLPPSLSTSYSYWPPSYPGLSSPLQQQYHHYPWEPQLQQHAVPGSSSFLDSDSWIQAGADDSFTAMLDHLSQSAPFAHPQVQMQFATVQPYPSHQAMAYQQSHRAMAAPVEAVPLADVAANGPALPTGDEGANKPAPRRRGRPRKNPAASSPKQPAPRRKNSSAAASSRKARQPAAKKVTNNAVAVSASGQQAAACTNALNAMQSTSITSNPLAWEQEASMMEEKRMEPYAEIVVPGVRFQPTNDELIGYLRLKYLGRKMPVDFIKDSNVYQTHPETVTASCGESVNGCWYVFSPRRRRYPKGGRPARSVGTDLGFWKSNTKETDVRVGGSEHGAAIGKVTALTFELGHQPHGVQTPWKMKEYSIPEKQHKPDGSNVLLDDWVLCKIFCNARDDKDTQIMIPAEEGDELDDVDGIEGDEEMHIANVEQGGQPAGADYATGDGADMQIVFADQVDQTLSNSEEDLCVEDYFVSDATFRDHNDAGN